MNNNKGHAKRILYVVYITMVSPLRFRWNSVYSDLIRLHLRLEEISCTEHNGQIVTADKTQEGDRIV